MVPNLSNEAPPPTQQGAAPCSPSTRLPVVLIAGYLGAGKTTLVNHLLRQAQGRRIAVLVNDFGSINIDAELIAANADADCSAGVLSLAGGCLCCSFGDDLVGTLGTLAQRTPPPDVCLIELSGVALPAGVVRTARLSPAVDVVGTLVLADAEHIERQAADRYVGDTVMQQLQQADWLLLNKPDLVAAAALQATAAWLQRVVPHARQWAGTAQTLWPELLLGWQRGSGEDDGDSGDDGGSAPGAAAAPGASATATGQAVGSLDGPPVAPDQAALASFAARPLAGRKPSTPRADAIFESFGFTLAPQADLDALGAQLAAADSGVLRAKGLLGGRLLQVAGGRWAVTPAGACADTPLVLIGLRGRWNPQALMQRWGA
jgi:G3E family GTPase